MRAKHVVHGWGHLLEDWSVPGMVLFDLDPEGETSYAAVSYGANREIHVPVPVYLGDLRHVDDRGHESRLGD